MHTAPSTAHVCRQPETVWRGQREDVLLEQQPTPDAWVDAETRYQVGQQVHGQVTRVAHFGVFVQLEPGLEGVLYAFEMGPGALRSLTPGQDVQLSVKDVDAGRRRLELSLEPQSAPSPVSEWEVPGPVRRQRPVPGPALPLPLPESVGMPAARSCPNCQRPVQFTWKYCVYCAGTLQRRCLACGTAQPDLAGARYCCECGSALEL